MGNLLIGVGNVSVGIQHMLASGHDFNAALPTTFGAITVANGLNKFPIDTVGGLFNFEQHENIIITQFSFNFGGSVAYTLNIINTDASNSILAGETITVAGGTASTFHALPRLTLSARQMLQLVTTGGVGAMVARVYAVQERGFRG